MLTAEKYCNGLKGDQGRRRRRWRFIGDQKMKGITKNDWVFTSAGCCQRNNVAGLFKRPKEVRLVQSDSKKLEGKVQSKGYAWVQMCLPNGISFTFIGAHADTKTPLETFESIRGKLPIGPQEVHVMAGDWNIRMRDVADPTKPKKCAQDPCTKDEVMRLTLALTLTLTLTLTLNPNPNPQP